ncbi:HisA/HisF-related TIM barrel protein [Methanoregula sp. UBA64]|jgi:phosphoribosylformimino-5-aminoimidazole carboxamide ribotide isomerase|uniref:HisA/HisF-related TIM barrel protein n=1 Tax=Methanoregula sp. UBA64 TaxID=1915554 RepID=UPI0025D8E730|nr:HisA/HisF-related TIM barrel protein [Methanoregula sp. UBA64]
MELVLAMDLRGNTVVHGKSGLRATYKPLDWGLSPTAEPVGFVQAIAPKFLYIADLDRIEGTGSHDALIRRCADLVDCCYVDRGVRGPADFLSGPHIKNIVGTETGGAELSRYRGGFLSVDVKDRKVIPSGASPESVLRAAREMAFEGCILLNLGFVGTEHGFGSDSREVLASWRSAYPGKLLYGGGVATVADLEVIHDAGFDGAIIATALHKGAVPAEWIRKGCMC